MRRILCPVDFSSMSKQAFEYAAALSAWYGARLTALHVCPPVQTCELVSTVGASSAPSLVFKNAHIEESRAKLRGFTRIAAGRLPVEVLVNQGDPKREIIKSVSECDADLLVMGTHGRSTLDHVLLGSVAENVMRKASCPVLIVPPRASDPAHTTGGVFKRIVCAVDFSVCSKRALDYALNLAQESDARLTLHHSIEFPIALKEVVFSTDANVDQLHAAAVAEYLRRLRALVPAQARMYCTVTANVGEGKPYREIQRVASAERADLIVMGVQGRGALNRMFFGSNTHAVIRHAQCPVLIVPEFDVG